MIKLAMIKPKSRKASKYRSDEHGAFFTS